MLKKTKSNRLTLRVGEDLFAFDTPKDLEFALSGRTGLPAAKVMELIDASDTALVEEAQVMRRIEETICDVIADTEHEDYSAGVRLLDRQQLQDIYWDNGWRAIMNALSGLDSTANPYKRVGLEKYLQFLANRRQVVQKIYASRHIQNPQLNESAARPLVDLTTHLSEPSAEHLFKRLPKGEPIEFRVGENQTLTLLLAKHKFSIVRADDFRFVDDSGSETTLGEGRNVIGRDETSDIIVDEEYRDVSRQHLIVETESTGIVRLTDISSMGTCVPGELLS